MAGSTVSLPALRSFLIDLLQVESLFEYDAETIAEALLLGERLACRDEGLACVPRWIQQIREGGIDPRGQVLVLSETPSLCLLDGSSAAGPVAAAVARKWITEHLEAVGMVTVLVRNSRALGCARAAVAPLAEAGWLAEVETSAAPGEAAATADRCHVTIAVPTSDGVAYLADDRAPLWLSLLTNGRRPGEKPAAPNPLQVEHQFRVAHPDHAMGADALARRLGQSFDLTPPPLPDTISLTDETAAALATLGEAASLTTPW